MLMFYDNGNGDESGLPLHTVATRTASNVRYAVIRARSVGQAQNGRCCHASTIPLHICSL